MKGEGASVSEAHSTPVEGPQAGELRFTRTMRDALDVFVDEATRDVVLAGHAAIHQRTRSAKRAAWASEVMERMDARLPQDVRAKVRERCACGLSGWRPRRMRAIAAEHLRLDARLAAIAESGIVGRSVERSGDTVTVRRGLDECECRDIRAAARPVSPTWCECCKGRIARLFEAAGITPERMEVVESRISGGSDGVFRMRLPAT